MITQEFSIPNDEIVITASRSSGPGGQNVNKVNTRVTLHFSLWSSKYLTNNPNEEAQEYLDAAKVNMVTIKEKFKNKDKKKRL